MTRELLPNRRPSENLEIEFAGIPVAVTFGYSDDGRIVEVFLSTRKIGTPVDTACRDMAVILSIALQYGATPTVLLRSLTADEHGRPEGLAGKLIALIVEHQHATQAEAARVG